MCVRVHHYHKSETEKKYHHKIINIVCIDFVLTVVVCIHTFSHVYTYIHTYMWKLHIMMYLLELCICIIYCITDRCYMTCMHNMYAYPTTTFDPHTLSTDHLVDLFSTAEAPLLTVSAAADFSLARPLLF